MLFQWTLDLTGSLHRVDRHNKNGLIARASVLSGDDLVTDFASPIDSRRLIGIDTYANNKMMD